MSYLLLGDVLTLESILGSHLFSDILGNVTWNSSSSAECIDRCLWRVCKRLQYAEQEIAAQLKSNKKGKKSGDVPSNVQVQKEISRNLSDLEESVGHPVKYGDIIQLQLVTSGEFLSAKQTPARHDKDCFTLRLTKGSSASYFKVLPRYKVRTEGGSVLLDDEVLFQSVSFPEFFVHISVDPFTNGARTSTGGYMYHEANLGSDKSVSGVKVCKYARYLKSVESNRYLKIGQPFRLFDRERESFVEAPCDLDAVNNEKQFISIGDRLKDSQSINNPTFFSSKTVWCLENLNPFLGGLAEFNKPIYRIKHIPSKRYLTVGKQVTKIIEMEDGKVVVPSASSVERVDDCLELSLEPSIDDEADGKSFTQQIFQVKFVGHNTSFIPKQDAVVLISHRAFDGRECFLHSTKKGSLDQDRKLRMLFQPHTYDALVITDIDQNCERHVSFLMYSIPYLHNFSRRISTGEIDLMKTSPNFNDIKTVLNRLINRSFFYRSGDLALVDWDKERKTLDGISEKTFQNCARDQLTLEALLEIVVSPVRAKMDMCQVEAGIVSRNEKNKWRDIRFAKIAPIHLSAWKAIQALSRQNIANELYFVNIKSYSRVSSAAEREKEFEDFSKKLRKMEEEERELFKPKSLLEIEDGSGKEIRMVPDDVDYLSTRVASQSVDYTSMIPTDTGKQAIFEGVFFKEGSFVKSWKKRYFQLFDDGSIVYKESKESTSIKGVFETSGPLEIRLFDPPSSIASQGCIGMSFLSKRRGGFFRVVFSSPEDCKGFVKALLTINTSNNMLQIVQVFPWYEEVKHHISQLSGANVVAELESVSSDAAASEMELMKPRDSFVGRLELAASRQFGSSSSAKNEDPVQSGFFFKEGSLFRSWKYRYYTIFPNQKLVYKESSSSTSAKGSFNMSGYLHCELFNGSPFVPSVKFPIGFSILSREKSGYMRMVFEGEESFKEFARALNTVNSNSNLLETIAKFSWASEIGSNAPASSSAVGSSSSSASASASTSPVSPSMSSPVSHPPSTPLPSPPTLSGSIKSTIGSGKSLISSMVSKAVAKVKGGYSDPSLSQMSGLNVVVLQIQFPVGAAEVLSSLITNNQKLLDQMIVDKSTMAIIRTLKDRIADEGPDKRFLTFFSTICSCNNQALKKNQDICFRDFVSVMSNCLIHVIASNEFRSANQPVAVPRPMDTQYLGRDTVNAEQFDSVYVYWDGVKDWNVNSKKFYYSSSDLRLPTVLSQDGKELVAIEDFCRVLMMGESENDTRAGIQNQLKIAEYFVEQIKMFAEMVLGRNYSNIEYFEKIFPYQLCVSIIQNRNLPLDVRSVFIRLTRRLWLERFPHQHNCGHHAIPYQIWIYDQIEDFTFDDVGALPHFDLHDASSEGSKALPFYTINSINKFYWLSNFALTFLDEEYIRNREDIPAHFTKEQMDACVTEVINLVSSLTSLGFLSAHDLSKATKHIIPLLDGRLDAYRYPDPSSRGFLSNLNVAKLALTSDAKEDITCAGQTRYEADDEEEVNFYRRKNIIHFLRIIENFKHNFQLGRVLSIFRQMILARDHKSCCPSLCAKKELFRGKYNLRKPAHVTAALTKIFDENSSEDNLIDYFALSEVSIDSILLDLLMYKDEDLFEEVYHMLIRCHEEESRFVSCLKRIKLLPDEHIAIFGTFSQLKKESTNLQRLFECCDQWEKEVVDSSLLTSVQKAREILNKVSQFLDTDNKKEAQEILYLLGIHETLFYSLTWGVNTEDSRKVTAHCLVILKNLVQGNDSNREHIIHHFHDLLQNQFTMAMPSYKDELAALVATLYKSSPAIIAKTPINFYEVMCNWALANPLANIPKVLSFFKEQLLPRSDGSHHQHHHHNSHHHEHNHHAAGHHGHHHAQELSITDYFDTNYPVVQNNIIGWLMEMMYTFAKSVDTSANHLLNLEVVRNLEKFEDYLLCAEVFSLCCRQNIKVNAGIIAELIKWDKVLRPMVRGMYGYIENKEVIGGLGIGAAYIPSQKKEFYFFKMMSNLINFVVSIFMNPKKVVDESIFGSNLFLKFVNDCVIVLINHKAKLDALKTAPVVETTTTGDAAASTASSSSLSPLDIEQGDQKGSQMKMEVNPMKNRRKSTVVVSVVSAEELQKAEDHFLGSVVYFFTNYMNFVESTAEKTKIVDACQDLLVTMESEEESVTGVLLDRFVTKYGKKEEAVTKRTDLFSGLSDIVGSVLSKSPAKGHGHSKSHSKSHSTHSKTHHNHHHSAIVNEYHNFVDSVVAELPIIKKHIVSEELGLLDLFLHANSITTPENSEYQQYLNKYQSKAIRKQEEKKGTTTLYSLLAFRPVQVEKLKEYRPNVVEWKDVVERLIRHVDNRIYCDSNWNVSINILETLILYLLEGKKLDEANKKVDLVSMESTVGTQFKQRQNELCNFKVIHLIYRIISAHGHGRLFNKALELGNLMFEGGNENCQSNLIEYTLSGHDIEGKFFLNLRNCVLLATDWVNQSRTLRERKGSSSSSSAAVVLTTDDRKHENEIIDILRFLKQICEGHNLAAQNLLRDQANKRQTYDIIEACQGLLEALAPRKDIFRQSTLIHCEITLSVLYFLIEALQGPCSKNQDVLQRLNIFVSAGVILSTESLTNTTIPSQTLLALKVQVITLLGACLEGRSGYSMEVDIISTIEKRTLDNVQEELLKHVLIIRKFGGSQKDAQALFSQGRSSSSSSSSSESSSESGAASDDESENSETSLVSNNKLEETFAADLSKLDVEASIVAVKNLFVIRSRLSKVNSEYRSLTVSEIPEIFRHIYGDIVKNMRVVEVQWEDNLEEVLFPIPNEARFLSEISKNKFLNECNVDTADTRSGDLIDNMESFMDEMSIYYQLSKTMPTFSWYLSNYFNIKAVLLAASVLLNFHIIIGVTHPNVFDIKYKFNNTHIQIKVVLGLFILLGYFLLTLYRIVPSVPMVARSLRRSFDEKITTKFDFSAMRQMVVLSWVYFAGCVIHYYTYHLHYTMRNLIEVYIIIFIVLFVPYFCKSLRMALLNPSGPFEFVYCLIYDVVLDERLLSHLFFGGAAVVGLLYDYTFFSLLLLEFVLLSEHAFNTIRSVTKPWKALSNLVLIFLIAFVIFGMFGYSLFGVSQFIQQNSVQCDSMIGCLSLVLYEGILNSQINGAMESINPGEAIFVSRFFYDIIFFIVIGALLFNMVTGIIVDTFASLRDETESREAILKSESFVSGISLEALDESDITFTDLQEQRQNIWNYVYYLFYLKNTEETERTGLESFVLSRFEAKNYDWLPKKNCIAFEKLKFKASHAKNSTSKSAMSNEELIDLIRQCIKEEFNTTTSK